MFFFAIQYFTCLLGKKTIYFDYLRFYFLLHRHHNMPKRTKYQIEFVIRSSPVILYNFLSTPSGLSLWFADHVDRDVAKITSAVYSFFWEGFEEKAECLETIENEMIRYRWLEGDDEEFFEFRIEKVDVTNDTVLVVNDFADDYEVEDQKRLWASQIKTLSIQIGGG